jgi:hypothetical protein
MGVELDNQKLRLLKRQGDVLPTWCALPELALTQPAKMAPFEAGANSSGRIFTVMSARMVTNRGCHMGISRGQG